MHIKRWFPAVFLMLLSAGCMSANTSSPDSTRPPVQQVKMQHSTDNIQSPANDAWTAEDAEKVILRKPQAPIRGIYVTSNVARSRRMEDLIKLVDQTELNAMVIDVADMRSTQKLKQLMEKLKAHRIYTIARIVTFKNAALASAMPEWSMKRKDGRPWQDRSGTPWIDPYRQEAWEYPLKLAEYAVSIGFDEVQFDYVRFPENEQKVDLEVAYANPYKWTKHEAIRRFLHRAAVRVHKAGARISADVFGLVGSINGDMGIGQHWDSISQEVDVISPMIYPSHYLSGIWGIDHPDLMPHSVVTHVLRDITARNEQLHARGIDTAMVRPWLQSFTATWIHPHQTYGIDQVRQQIDAARAAGYSSYLLWNSSNRYPIAAR